MAERRRGLQELQVRLTCSLLFASCSSSDAPSFLSQNVTPAFNSNQIKSCITQAGRCNLERLRPPPCTAQMSFPETESTI